jgi:HAD superfamily hydrolase (TIGR01493 family)
MRSSRVEGVLLDLLMGVMNSLERWTAAAGNPTRGLLWRDAVTARMVAAGAYTSYEHLLTDAAAELDLDPNAPGDLVHRWADMEPWPDAAAIHRLSVPYGFVTNCSRRLAQLAADGSGLAPRVILSAEEAGWFKPDARVYLEACRRLGSAAERTAFIAGSPYDADGASAAGLPTWLVRRRPDQQASVGSVSVVASLDDAVESISRW